jgi:hypothetical protein
MTCEIGMDPVQMQVHATQSYQHPSSSSMAYFNVSARHMQTTERKSPSMQCLWLHCDVLKLISEQSSKRSAQAMLSAWMLLQLASSMG